MNEQTRRLAEKIALGASFVIALIGLLILNWLFSAGSDDSGSGFNLNQRSRTTLAREDSCKVDFEPVLRRPIETARLTRHVGRLGRYVPRQSRLNCAAGELASFEATDLRLGLASTIFDTRLRCTL
jgi:hypothetical protein